MPGHGQTLILPVETQIREMDPKILFSCIAAERGFTAIVGSQAEIHLNIEKMPRGIYVSKDIRSSKRRMLRIVNDLGHRIVAWDEEGLVRYPREQYHRSRIDPEALERTLMFFAWGEDDAETLAAYPRYEGTPIHRTGNPRIDLLRPPFWPIYEDEAAALRKRFGHYILINTNFGNANHFLPPETIKKIVETRQGDDRERTEWEDALAPYRDAMFRHFIEALPVVAKAFPETTVILRPHPSESHEAWREAAKGCANVQVVYEGSVHPWVFGADVVMHNGCTTAIEASLLGRPAVSYRPIQSERFDRHFPDSISYQAFDLDELTRTLGRFVGEGREAARTEAQKTVLDRHLAIDGDRLSSEHIVDILGSSDALNGAGPRPSLAGYVGGWIKAKRRARQKKANSLDPSSKNSERYEKHRFPGVSLQEVEEKIALYGGLLGRFQDVRAEEMSAGIFKIRKA